MITTTNFLSDLIETDKIGSIFWLCLGIILILQEKLKEEKESIALAKPTAILDAIA